MGLSNKQEPKLKVKVYVSDSAIILEVEKDLEDQANESDEDKPSYVLCPLLFTHVEKEED